MSKVNGKAVWFEVVTPDGEATARFYSEAFGWKPIMMPMADGAYTMFQAGEHRPQCGIDTWKPGQPAHWVGYIEAGDIEEALERVKKHGGTVIPDPRGTGEVIDAPGVGKMAQVKDPQGGMFYVFQGNEHDDSPYDSAPGKFHWFELTVPDAKAVLPFYKAVFDYDIESADMGTGIYHVFNSGGESRAGTMDSPAPGMPPAWTPYVNVDDVDATIARVVKLGGSSLFEPMDVPDIGRIGMIADPHGAVIGVMTPPARG